MATWKLLYVIWIFKAYGQQWYVKNEESLAFTNQDALCQFRYETSLASIHNNTQNTAATSRCESEEPCWIGLNDILNEGEFEWVDDTIFDFGSDTSGGVAPWAGYSLYPDFAEPNDYDGFEDCVEIYIQTEYTGSIPKWNDKPCSTEREGLCNYPTTTHYVINDDPTTQRIPSQSQIIGTMDVLDEIYVEFNLVINSFADDYRNILTITNRNGLFLPGVWMHGHLIHFSQSYVNQLDNPIKSGVSLYMIAYIIN